jgi:uncharacterized DUF497 family protein
MTIIYKRLEWDESKNQQLQNERDLSFEQLQVAIEQNKLIDIIPHPKKEHAHQQILLIDIDEYIVLVPFVEDEERIFLKTAFKSRKATREYLRGKKDGN